MNEARVYKSYNYEPPYKHAIECILNIADEYVDVNYIYEVVHIQGK